MIKDVETEYPGKQDYITYLRNLLQQFKEAADAENVEKAYNNVLKTLA